MQSMMGALAAATFAALVPAVADMERAVELRDDRGEDDEEDAAPTPVRFDSHACATGARHAGRFRAAACRRADSTVSSGALLDSVLCRPQCQ